jgi:hypothetical protein
MRKNWEADPQPSVAWGNWRLTSLDGSYYFEYGDNQYLIELSQCSNSAQLLDWIYQIKAKPAFGSERIEQVVLNLISAFGDVLDPQKNICSHGADTTIDANQVARDYVARSANG